MVLFASVTIKATSQHTKKDEVARCKINDTCVCVAVDLFTVACADWNVLSFAYLSDTSFCSVSLVGYIIMYTASTPYLHCCPGRRRPLKTEIFVSTWAQEKVVICFHLAITAALEIQTSKMSSIHPLTCAQNIGISPFPNKPNITPPVVCQQFQLVCSR